eukprot:3270680-Prymnesium_polylepis.2
MQRLWPWGAVRALNLREARGGCVLVLTFGRFCLRLNHKPRCLRWSTRVLTGAKSLGSAQASRHLR